MDNRSALLKCALDLFAARGYDAVGVQEVVEAAGITKPTLYHYFGSKQGLLQALLSEHFERLNAQVRQAAEYHGDLTLSLTELARAYFGFAREHRTYYRLQLSFWFAPRESEAFKLVAELNQQQYHLVEEMFVQAVKEHGNMRGRHRAYATTFIGLINTYIGMWLNGYVELDEHLVYNAVHQFEHGIYS
jgi:TetR/AcrR family transcriptional regulator